MNIHHFKRKLLNKNNKIDKGFSFIETLISVFILLIVVSGILTMTTISIETNFKQINHTKAVKLAEEGIERKLREDFDSLSGEISDFGSIRNFPTYSRRITINTIDIDNKTIEVSVTWQVRNRSGLKPITLAVRRTR